VDQLLVVDVDLVHKTVELLLLKVSLDDTKAGLDRVELWRVAWVKDVLNLQFVKEFLGFFVNVAGKQVKPHCQSFFRELVSELPYVLTKRLSVDSIVFYLVVYETVLFRDGCDGAQVSNVDLLLVYLEAVVA
jgi:hypothetical protein